MEVDGLQLETWGAGPTDVEGVALQAEFAAAGASEAVEEGADGTRAVGVPCAEPVVDGVGDVDAAQTLVGSRPGAGAT